MNLGLALGLLIGDLQAIKESNHCDTDSCFTAMLTDWLTNGEDRKWSVLADALENCTVGMRYLANCIRESHCK